MKYLDIEFQNAGLIIPNTNHKREGFKHFVNGQGWVKINGLGVDLEHPVGVNQLANMLHVMCGIPPVASKRETIFTRSEDIFSIAKNSYIKYYNKCDVDPEKKADTFQGAKAAVNSNSKIASVFGGKKYLGYYSWSYLRKIFLKSDKENYKQLIGFFNDVLNSEDVTKEYTFNKFITKFHEHLEDEEVKEFIEYLDNDGKEIKKILLNPWMSLLFYATPPSGGNVTYKSKTPILNVRGIDFKRARFSGSILVPIPEEKEYLIDCIREYGVLPTILDDGLVIIKGLKNYVSEARLNEYKPVFSEENEPQNTESEDIM